uniref:peptidyl-tRNA hydrolase n=1 Tax=Strongyloides papillosus TaxID=174720 RepID=A0A0N5BAX8_STREA
MVNKSSLGFLKKGLPFFAIIFGGVYGLQFFQKVRYDFRQVKKEEVSLEEVKEGLQEGGLRVKEKVTVDNIFQEINEIDTENWQNIRGPRDFESNEEYLKAKKEQQEVAVKIRKERKLVTSEIDNTSGKFDNKEEQEDKEKKEIDVTEIVTEEDKQLYYDEVVGCIIEFGISDNVETALLAAKRTYPLGVDAAIDWIIERSNQSDFESSSSESEDTDLDMGGYTSQPVSGDVLSQLNTLRKSLRKYKMVLVVNMALGMGKGKLAAQVGHAVLGTYKHAMKTPEGQTAISHWEKVGQVKVVVKGQDTEQLMDIFKASKDKGLWSYIVQDAGYTQIPPGSRTVVGIFGPVEDVDDVTGSLKLL